MAASFLDGRRVAAAIRAEATAEAARLAAEGIVPTLAVVLVGDHPASAVYVRSKETAAREAGLGQVTRRLGAETGEAELLGVLDELNENPEVDAILVQLPLPRQIDTARVLETIDPAKDVDGFHPLNIGRLAQGRPGPVPCTPAGILELLKREGVALRGTRAVVVGRSDVVGKPMAALLLRSDATVTIAHSKTRDLPAVCREAELLVAALGRPGFVTGEFVREGAVVVDVGINRLTAREDVLRFFPNDQDRLKELDRKGSTLIGDCDPVTVYPRASRVTPVPGGVGPLTIAMLLRNTVDLCRRRRLISNREPG